MDITFSGPQARAHRLLKPGNTVVCAWGRGVGKSWFKRNGVWYLRIAEAIATGKPVRIVLLMPTLEQAKKVHGQLMLDELSGQWAFLGGKVNRSDWRVSFPDGSWIQWVTAENARNARGIRCDIVSIDECDDVDVETYDAIVGPWLSEPHSLKIVHLSGTPTRGRHGLLYKRFRMGLDGVPGHYSIHATYLDVPQFVDVARVESERPFIDPSLFDREWLCDFDAAEGLVYPMFSEKFHVREHMGGPFREILVGVDHGFEDPGVFGIFGVIGNGRDTRVHQLEEVWAKHKTEEWWLARAREVLMKYGRSGAPMYWYCDPSQPSRIEAYRRIGCRIGETDNSIEDGLSTVADFIAIRRPDGVPPYAKFSISKQCKETIKEFGMYRRKRDPKDRSTVLDTPEDRWNHAMDQLRYALHSHFSKARAIRDVRNLGAA